MSRTEVVAFGPGQEFQRIHAILSDLPRPGAQVRVGPGDDAAVLADGTVISTDLAIEGIHFELDWITAVEAGYRAAAGAVSDLAAMAAEAVGVLVSVGASKGDQAESAMRGVKSLAREVGGTLLVGDLTRSPGPLVLDVISVGRAERPLLRSGDPGTAEFCSFHPKTSQSSLSALPGERHHLQCHPDQLLERRDSSSALPDRR